MSDLLKKIKTNSLVTAAVYTVLGLVLLVWPGLSASIFCTALGLVLLLCGLVDIVTFLLHRDGSLYGSVHLIVGIILAVVGVYVMTRPSLVTVVIPRIVGILICIHGISDVGDAISLHRSGYGRWSTALLLGLLTVVLGGVLIANPFGAFATVVRVIGGFLLYDGVSDLWIASRVSKVARQVKSDAEAQASAIDVDYTEETEQ
jgi:uncharacterized membrane protein HdeD (DUF308 family)